MPASRSFDSRRLDKLCTLGAWVGIAMLALALWMSDVAPPLANGLPEGLRSPVIALELIRDPAVLPSIVRGENRARAIRATRIDFAFIAAYTAFFCVIGLIVGAKSKWPGVVVIVAVGAAASFDVGENVAMLNLLGGTVNAAPRGWALAKWALVFSALGIGAIALVDREATLLRRSIGYVAVVVAVFAALEGWYGVISGHDKVIEAAAQRMVHALLLTEMFLATRTTLRNGVLAALDRLAARRYLRQIPDWPGHESSDTVGSSIFDWAPRSDDHSKL